MFTNTRKYECINMNVVVVGTVVTVTATVKARPFGVRYIDVNLGSQVTQAS